VAVHPPTRRRRRDPVAAEPVVSNEPQLTTPPEPKPLPPLRGTRAIGEAVFKTQEDMDKLAEQQRIYTQFTAERKRERAKPTTVIFAEIDAALKRLGPEGLTRFAPKKLARRVLDDINNGDGCVQDVVGIGDDLTIRWCPRKGRLHEMAFKTFCDHVARRAKIIFGGPPD
jgi:hypothetical protein